MKSSVLIGLFAAMSAVMAHASTVTLTLHGTGDDPVFDLGGAISILNFWGTPGDSNGTSDTMFFETSDLTDDIGTSRIVGLNLEDSTTTITSISLYAYGTIPSNNPATVTCTNDAPTEFTGCNSPGTTSGTILQSAPIVWTWTGGNIAPGTEFRIVDDSTITGSDLFYEIEINGAGPSNPFAAPEPATVIPAGATFLAMGLLAFRRKKRTRPSL